MTYRRVAGRASRSGGRRTARPTRLRAGEGGNAAPVRIEFEQLVGDRCQRRREVLAGAFKFGQRAGELRGLRGDPAAQRQVPQQQQRAESEQRGQRAAGDARVGAEIEWRAESFPVQCRRFVGRDFGHAAFDLPQEVAPSLADGVMKLASVQFEGFQEIVLNARLVHIEIGGIRRGRRP
jgi:hypothetical protein